MLQIDDDNWLDDDSAWRLWLAWGLWHGIDGMAAAWCVRLMIGAPTADEAAAWCVRSLVLVGVPDACVHCC